MAATLHAVVDESFSGPYGKDFASVVSRPIGRVCSASFVRLDLGRVTPPVVSGETTRVASGALPRAPRRDTQFKGALRPAFISKHGDRERASSFLRLRHQTTAPKIASHSLHHAGARIRHRAGAGNDGPSRCCSAGGSHRVARHGPRT